MRSRRSTAESLTISSLINTGEDPIVYGITEDMFYSYRAEFNWLASYPKLYGKKPTPEVLTHKFPDLPYIEGAEDVAYATDELIQNHTRKVLVKHVAEATNHIQEGDIESAMMAISSFIPPQRTQPLPNDLDDASFLQTYSEREETQGVPWKSLEQMTGGIRKGDLWYVAARLSQGKSWVLGNFAATALMEGRRVKFYTLEMTRYQTLIRMHVLLGKMLGADVDHIAMRDRIYDPVAYKKLLSRISKEVTGELHVHDSANGRVTPTNIAQDRDCDLVIIDYAGLMSTPLGDRAINDWRAMGMISNMLKEMALSTGVSIVAAAQINREGESSGAFPPKVHQLAQSDALGQDADVVITHKQMSKSVMVYSAEKNRHGVAGQRFYTRFQPNKGNFEEIDKETAEDIRDDEN